MVGATRSPVAVRPGPVPGNYTSMTGTIYLGWSGDETTGTTVARQRYDFPIHGQDFAQLYLQTEAQRHDNMTGAMVSVEPGECVCEAGIAGNMHVDSFVEHEALDPLDLPANVGGLSYLGRI